MASTTGIELGPDTCVLAGVRTTAAGAADIVALHTIEPAEWPAQDTALAEMLRGVRRSKGFPKRARVVAWGLPEDSANDPTVRAAMRPLADAGFRVASVITPPQALALLARTRSKPAAANNAVAWLALNMHGAAIAIVRGGELLFARTFQWVYNPHLLDGKAQLLQRYSLISHLAPELRRGIAAVRVSHGAAVDTVVTCGDLPELRSLTMPLIEELDLEVETLDSMDGMRPVGKAKFERLAEAAPAIRLACAAALAHGQQRQGGTAPPVGRIAAAAALVAVLGYGAYAYYSRVTAATPPPATQSIRRPVPTPAAETARQPRAGAPLPSRPEPSLVSAGEGRESSLAKVEQNPAPVVSTAGKTEGKPAPAQTAPAKTETPSVRTLRSNPAVASVARTESTAGRSFAPPPVSPEKSVAEFPTTAVPGPAPRADLAPARPSADTGGVVFPPAPRPAPQTRQVPLKDPLPKIDSILIDQERRLAIIEGAVVAVGDSVGARVVAEIDRDTVTLREPSGLFVRVPLRGRQ